MNGKEWMNRCECEFPVSTVSQITLSGAEKSAVSSECNKPDITDQIYTISSYGYERPCFPARIVPGEVNSRYKFSQYLIDPFRLRKIIRIIGLVYLFIKKSYAAIGKFGRLSSHPKVIPANLSSKGDQYLATTGSQDAQSPFKCLGGLATNEVKKFVNMRSYGNIYTDIDGALHYTGRILPSMEEGDGKQLGDVMYDLSRTTFCVPITDKHSPIAPL